jgi:hypothetical protein
MLPLLLGLVALIPGAGPVMAFAGSAAGAAVGRVLTNKYVLLAIAVAVLALSCDIHGHRVERRHCDARIEHDHKAAAAAAARRDREIAAEIEQKYGTTVAALQKQSDDLQQQVLQYEQQLFQAKQPRCELGPESTQRPPFGVRRSK